MQGKCQLLTLRRVRDAKLVVPNEKVDFKMLHMSSMLEKCNVATYSFRGSQVMSFVQSNPDLRVTNFSSSYNFDVVHHQIILETAPSGGLFEVIIHLNLLTIPVGILLTKCRHGL